MFLKRNMVKQKKNMTTMQFKSVVKKAREIGGIPRNWRYEDQVQGPNDISIGFRNPNYNTSGKGDIDRTTYTRYVSVSGFVFSTSEDTDFGPCH